MRFDVKALAITSGVLWGAAFFLVGLGNQVFDGYGAAFLEFGASLYPGYHGPGGFGSVLVVTLYALVDGAICGAVFAWLYNRVAGRKAAGAA